MSVYRFFSGSVRQVSVKNFLLRYLISVIFCLLFLYLVRNSLIFFKELNLPLFYFIFGNLKHFVVPFFKNRPRHSTWLFYRWSWNLYPSGYPFYAHPHLFDYLLALCPSVWHDRVDRLYFYLVALASTLETPAISSFCG